MKRFITSLLTFLILSSAITPAVLAGEESKNHIKYDISDYQKDLLDLNEKVAEVYQDLNMGDEPRSKSSYVHVVGTAEEASKLIGKTNKLVALLSGSEFESTNTSLGSQLDDVGITGLSSELKDDLIEAGYTLDDIEALEKKLIEYNAYLYRISTDGFSPEEIQSLRNAGYTDEDIENLKNKITQRYFSNFNAGEQLNASKNELYQVQATLSILGLKLLINSSEGKGEISPEQIEHLGKLEKRLIGDIDKLGEKEKWNHIRDDAKGLYKYSEMLIKKADNASEFSADYFIGMQMHLAAITALEGDEKFALDIINSYRLALEDLANERLVECEEWEKYNGKSGKGSSIKVKATSIAGPLANFLKFKGYEIRSAFEAIVLKTYDGITKHLFSIPAVSASSPIIGQVDELDETNNVAVIRASRGSLQCSRSC